MSTNHSASLIYLLHCDWSTKHPHYPPPSEFQSVDTALRPCRAGCVKSKGSVTIPLHCASFVGLEPETSNEFHLLIVHGQNLETFTTNDSILVMKGDADLENVVVTKWLSRAVQYREFQVPLGWSDGSDLHLKGHESHMKKA